MVFRLVVLLQSLLERLSLSWNLLFSISFRALLSENIMSECLVVQMKNLRRGYKDGDSDIKILGN